MHPPRFERTGPADGKILIGEECVAEIAALHLRNLRLGPGGEKIIGTDVPLPLYWRQYAHHEEPGRNAGLEGRVEQIPAGDGEVRIVCEGTNAGSEIRSAYTLSVRGNEGSRSYVVEIAATLEVLPGKRWRITHNPSHGEMEFCNLWPERTFLTRGEKAYSACFVERGESVTLIPHTHLESSDKHDIRMGPHDRFGWLLEDENPVIELLTADEARAGLCAYMWDAHIGYRACNAPGEILLPPGYRREARFRITRADRSEGAALLARGVAAEPPEAGRTPLYVRGLNTFRERLTALRDPAGTVWPWSFESPAGEQIEGTLDDTRGYDDLASLRIRSEMPSTGIWAATTLGPAFGDPPFRDGARYRLSMMVSTELFGGEAGGGLRLHREGAPRLGDTGSYEQFWTEAHCSGTSGWTRLELITPPISPPPDRMHILLRHRGKGTSWFDNVLLEEYA